MTNNVVITVASLDGYNSDASRKYKKKNYR
jgi:hypothetical protein